MLELLDRFLMYLYAYIYFVPIALLIAFLVADWIRDRYRAAHADPDWRDVQEAPPAVHLYSAREGTESHRQMKTLKPRHRDIWITGKPEERKPKVR
jgi:hypothetical protein